MLREAITSQCKYTQCLDRHGGEGDAADVADDGVDRRGGGDAPLHGLRRGGAPPHRRRVRRGAQPVAGGVSVWSALPYQNLCNADYKLKLLSLKLKLYFSPRSAGGPIFYFIFLRHFYKLFGHVSGDQRI